LNNLNTTFMHIQNDGTFLIPIDYSKQSLNAIKHAFNLARYTNSKLHLMYVYEDKPTHSDAELKELAASTAKESGLQCSCSSIKGDIYEITEKYATEKKCTMIVAGLDTHVKFRSFMSRASSSKFIKNAPCPVLTIRSNTFSPDCKNILMPFDLSPESREKVPAVIQLAKFYGADIRVVSIFDPGESEYENALLPYLNQVKKYIKENNVNCTNKSIPAKDVAESIVDYANKNNCDIIVQMNKRDLSFGEMFSGTMSQKMVDISNVPVLTINPMKRRDMPLSY
jgi:nucleotide-binding universal stress UspA family protein